MTSVRTSSRWSRPRATPPAAGARRGSARRPAARGPPPTTWRSTGTSAASGSTSRRRAGTEVLRRLLARGDVVVENHRVGGFRPARLRRRHARAAEPRTRPPGDLRASVPSGPAASTPGYDFAIQAASGLMSITGAPDADGGGPTKVGVAISDVVTGMLGAVSVLAALLGRERHRRAPRRHSGVSRAEPRTGGQRIDISLLGATLASLVNQAQNAFVTGHGAGAARERASRTSFRTRRSRRPTGRSRWRWGPSASGRGSARSLGLPELADGPAVRDQRGPRRPPRDAAPDPRRTPASARLGRMAGRPRGRVDPVRADQRRRRRVRLGRGPGSRHGRRAGASGLGRHPPGRRPVQAGGHPGHDPDAAAALGEHADGDPRRAGLHRRARSRPCGPTASSEPDPPSGTGPASQLLATEGQPGDARERTDQHDRGDRRAERIHARAGRAPGRGRARRARSAGSGRASARCSGSRAR